MSYKMFKGDSLWFSVAASANEVSAVDSDWTNFACSWEIQSTLGANATLSGNMTRADTVGVFTGQIPTANSANLAVGSYKFVFQVTNTTQDYKQEIQDKLVVVQEAI